jgi:tetratricopeptide (TPR) repeat protein
MFRKVNVPDDIVYNCAALGWLEVEEGNVARAEEYLQLAESMPPGGIRAHVDGAILSLKGAIQARRGGDAEALLRKALETLPENAVFERLRAKRELGVLLRARADPAAAALLEEAARLARECGDGAAAREIEKAMGPA